VIVPYLLLNLNSSGGRKRFLFGLLSKSIYSRGSWYGKHVNTACVYRRSS